MKIPLKHLQLEEEMDNRAIGVFDSGVGGLTVVNEIQNVLPNESVVYLGDTARVPYGNRSEETIKKFSLECAKFLEKKDIKVLIIACNTVSAVAMDYLKERLNIPVFGVVLAGSKMAVNITENKRVGIIGTLATINNGAYEREIKEIDSEINTFSRACPLFVPIVEEGLQDTEMAFYTIKYYISELIKNEIDTLVMGCTHYPILENSIKKVTGNQLKLVNPAKETVKSVMEYIKIEDIENKENTNYKFFVTDNAKKFKSTLDSVTEKSEYELIEVDLKDLKN